MEIFEKIRNISFFAIFWICIKMLAADVVGKKHIRLNISESFLDVRGNDTIFLKCSGDPPLFWGYIDPTVPENEKEIADIETEHEINTNSFGNESVIRLTLYLDDDTGRYICYNSQFNASVYIFVDGGEKLLLPVFGMRNWAYIHFYHGKPDIIPCLPTVSKANVTLWKVRGSNKEFVPLEFDATMGFILKNPTDYFQKSFMCVAMYEDKESNIHLDLETIRETESIPQVYINDNNAKYVVVGSTFRLECVVQTELNTMITVNWSYPLKDTERVIQKDLPIMKSNAYQNVTKELHILDTRKSDEGSYQCNATDHSNKENYAEVYVKVYETPQEPKVYFDAVHEEIIKTRHETVELIAQYTVFPFSSDIRAVWTKDKHAIVSGFKKYFAKSTDSTFSLEISNLSWRDSGLYTIEVNAPGGLSVKTFLLRVKDKPVINIQTNASCCYRPRQNYTILCESIGYPPPKVSWSWKPYNLNATSQYNSSEIDLWETLEEYYTVNNSTIKVENDGDKILSYLSVIADKSGFYKCESENNFGVTDEEIIFIVTDVTDGFEIVCDNEFPDVNTYFSATCKASTVLYSDLFWMWIPEFSNESIIVQMGTLDYSDALKSISLLLEFKEILKNQSGSYICMATFKNNQSLEEKSISINVRDYAAEAVEGQESGLDVRTLVILSCIGIAIFILFLVYLVILFTRKKKSMTVIHDFDQQLFQEGRMALFDPNLPLEDQVDLLPYDEKWEFPKEKLKLGRTVGQGAFGRVVKAEAFGINDYETSSIVAIKMSKERADSNQQKALMDELKILIHLGHHVNIVNLMGAVTKNIPKGELMVIVEYCRYGNIRHYLHRHRDTFVDEIDPETGKVTSVSSSFFDEKNAEQPFVMESIRSSVSSSSGIFAVDNPSYRQTRGKPIVSSNPRGSTSSHTLMYSTSGSSGSGSLFRNYYRVDSQEHIITTSDLLCFAFQCACGMEYLTTRKLIHRDLAARNVLLADDKIVKICDFGLAKDCYKYSNYIKKGDGPLPIKWMSIESIWDHVFTTKSDVWSFGILLWEFFTLGGNPYPGIDIDEEFYKKLKAGYRMEKPEMCPNFIYQIMKDCWNANPEERPHFSEILEILGDFLEDGVKQHYIDLNAPYMEMNRKMHAPDYSNIERLQCEEESPKLYVNSAITADTLAYDVPLVNRSIFNALVPKEPMEVVPMIQLETISEASSEVNATSNASDLLQITELYKPDYLHMGKTVEVTSNTQISRP